MKFNRLSLVLLISLSTSVWMGCTKQGPEGPAGPAGFDGNANIIYSPWYSPSWVGQTSDWYFDVASAAISKDIVEGGAILAYVSLPGDTYSKAVRPLPAYALGCNWDYLIPGYGQIEFISDATAKPAITNYWFRFILIPANSTLKSTKLKSLKTSDLKNMPYLEVCKLLGIPE